VDTEGNYVETVIAGDGVSVSGADAASASVTIGNTGVISVSGTSNEVEVSASTGSITIGLPSTIHANVQGNLTGNADSASALTTARTISLSGDVSGSVSFDGSSSVTITANIEPDSVALGADTTGNYVSQITSSGNGISVSGSGESASVTIENTGVHSIAGTANEILVSASSGSVTVGLPASVTIQSELNVLGNLTVSGSTTTINTQTLVVEDKNIEIGKVDEPTDTTANGGGITLKGTTDKTFNWIDATDSWTSSEHIDLANGKVLKHNGTEILSSTEYTGNAATSTKLSSEKTIALGGDLSGSASFDGSASISISATIEPNSVALGTDTTGDYVSSVSASGSGINVSGSGENASITIQNTGVTSISGTTNEIDVSASSGAITLSLPSTINADVNGNSASATYAQYLDGQSGSYYAPVSSLSDYLTESSAASTYQPLDQSLTSIVALAEGDGGFVSVTPGIYSETGWTTVTSNLSNDYFGRIRSIAHSNEIFITAGDFGEMRTSTDATTWTSVNSNFGLTSIFSIAYGNGLWVAGGSGGKMRTSTNGSTWTTVTSNFGNIGIQSIAYGNDLWVAGGGTGQMRTSTDATTWTTVTSNFGNSQIQSIAYANDLWIAAGVLGQMRTSTDATTWTTVTSNFGTTFISSIAYGNDLWIAAGGTGQMRTSTDATTWTTVTSNLGSETITSIRYGDGLWFAGSYSGNMRTSTDSITWNTSTSNFGGRTIASIVYKDNIWVAGGNYGQIRTNVIVNDPTSWQASDISTIYAPLSSPTFTGTPNAPTAEARTNTTQVATTEFVYEEVNKVSVDTKTESYTLAVSDAGKVIEMNVSSENNLTIPINSSVEIPIGTTIDIVQYGVGQTTLVPTSGVTIRSKEGALKLTGQYSAVSLYKRGTDEWVAMGDISA